jgi:hypothetical protein
VTAALWREGGGALEVDAAVHRRSHGDMLCAWQYCECEG